MAFSSSSSRVFCDAAARIPFGSTFQRTSSISWFYSDRISTFSVSTNAKKPSSPARTGKFDSKNRRAGSATIKEQEDGLEENPTAEIAGDETIAAVDDGFVVPELPGEKPDFWEGPQWDGLGFFVEYMWAFGIVFAVVACGLAVSSYNEGATDFKETSTYKESIQSRELLEGPDASNSDVFESNPTEQAPSLE